MIPHLLSKLHISEPINGISFHRTQSVNSALDACSTSTIFPFLRQIGNGSIWRASRRLNVCNPLFTTVPGLDMSFIFVPILHFMRFGKIPVIVLILHFLRHALNMTIINISKAYNVTYWYISLKTHFLIPSQACQMLFALICIFIIIKWHYIRLENRLNTRKDIL